MKNINLIHTIKVIVFTSLFHFSDQTICQYQIQHNSLKVVLLYNYIIL